MRIKKSDQIALGSELSVISQILRVLAVIIFVLFCNHPLSASDLPEKYRKWLEEEVVYLITPKEREVFLKLKNDRERDIFIEAFWKQRDPSPGTPRNEFREEHYRRLNYANQYLGRGTGKPGWKTDQGKIYIILGPPNNIETYENIMGIYPTQVWFYYGNPRYGLPAGFNIIFFKKEGTGEYILYSPSDHGPQALIADYMYNAKDARDAYQRLYQLSPNLAEQSLSLIPGEKPEPGVINLASNRLLATVMSIPQRIVEDTYAEAWYRSRDLIEVEYSTSYIKIDYEVWAVRSEAGHYFIHYSVEPAKISVEQEGSSYLVKFELIGRVYDEQNRTIYQFEKTLPVNLSKEKLAEVGKSAISFQDVFPLIPGDYKFDLLIKNPVSREFSSFSQKLQLPARTKAPEIGPILLAFNQIEARDKRGLIPYQVGRNQLLSRCRKSFSLSDNLVVVFQVLGLLPEMVSKAGVKISLLGDDKKIVYAGEKTLDNQRTALIEVETIPLSSLKPGYYTLNIDLLLEGKLVGSRRAELELSALPVVAAPVLVSRTVIQESEEWLLTGLQYLNTGNYREALRHIARAYGLQPGLREALAYAHVLLKLGDYSGMLEILKKYEQEDSPAELLSFLGQAYQSLNQPEKALFYYERYLDKFGINLDILNFAGTCYYQLGDKEKALSLWEKSLSLNPEQERLRELVRNLKKK